MNLMAYVIEPYKCTVCGEDTLFFVTRYGNNLIDYRYMIKKGMNLKEIEDYIKQRGVEKIKCMNCNKEYIMDFTKKYPSNIDTNDILSLLTEKQ